MINFDSGLWLSLERPVIVEYEQKNDGIKKSWLQSIMNRFQNLPNKMRQF